MIIHMMLNWYFLASSSPSLDEAAQKTSTDDNMDTYLLLFGGMDTAGLIFDDFFLLKIS